jgi:hypothetical protein
MAAGRPRTFFHCHPAEEDFSCLEAGSDPTVPSAPAGSASSRPVRPGALSEDRDFDAEAVASVAKRIGEEED